jgi:branched-chain amino acid transport system substrate-binding protein
MDFRLREHSLMTLRAIIVTLIVFAFGFTMQPASIAAEPYDIYAILSLTGSQAFLGQEEQVSLQAAQDVVNRTGGIRGVPVQFVIRDDQSNALVALQLANDIIAKHVPIFLGSTYLASCAAVAPVAKDGPVQYCFSPAMRPPTGSYTFAAAASTRDFARAALRYMRDRGWTRIAIIASSDATGQDGEAVVAENLGLPENAGLKLVDSERFNLNDISVGAQVARLKSANPQALFLWTVGPPFGNVLHALHDAALDVPVFSNAGNIVHAQLAQYKAFVPSQLYATGMRFLANDVTRPGPVKAAQTVFYQALHAHGVTEADMGHNMGWDATMVVIAALRQLGTGVDATKLHAYLEQLHSFAGTNGIFDYRDGNQRGVALSSVVIVRWNPASATFSTVSEAGGKPLH